MRSPELVISDSDSAAICVPDSWDEAQAIAFTEKEYPARTNKHWVVVRPENLPPAYRKLMEEHEKKSPCTPSGYKHVSLKMMDGDEDNF